MASLQHAALCLLLGRIRRNYPTEDLAGLRANLVRDNRAVQETAPADVRRDHVVQMTAEHGFPVSTLRRRDARPAAPGTARTVFYLHGGGFVKPADPAHWRFATRLAEELDADVVLPSYPLAPEFTVADSFPGMLELFAEVAHRSPGGVVLVGDSAGGGYALALAEALRDAGGPQPERLVLLAPWVDLTGNAPGTAQAAARDPWLSYEHLPLYAAFWAGSAEPAALTDPRVSPGLGDLAGLPPTLMFCGTRDTLQPGCDALARRARATAWDLEYVVGPGLLHVYPLLPVPEAKEAFDRVVDFCLPPPAGVVESPSQAHRLPLRDVLA